MSIFTRFKDIVSSNINSMLDSAENPEKLLRLMIQEMEDTLVELKASCAQVMADKARLGRSGDRIAAEVALWDGRAELALSKGREDLAREALLRKREILAEVTRLEEEVRSAEEAVGRYQDEIRQVEDKLLQARDKQRTLVRRHTLAKDRIQSQTNIRRFEHNDVIQRFDSFEHKIDRMEAEADLVNITRKSDLEVEFDRLHQDEQLEKELSALKEKLSSQ
ncbi:MAG: phage shock protein PspA [Opitutales bacterium]|jgi:phage shock protein A